MPTGTKAERAAKHARRAVELAEEARTPPSSESELGEDLRDILASLPAEADLRLYRKSTASGKLEYCESFADPTSFNEEYVATKWGAGVYRLMAKFPDPKTGKMMYVAGGTKTFTIAPRPVPANTPAPVDRRGELDTMTLMHQMMLQSQESHRAMIALMMQPKPDSSTELLKVLLPLLIGQKTDPMAMATQLATLLKPAGPVASMTDQLDALGKMMELAAKLGDKGGDDGPAWLSALKTAAPLIQQALSTPRPTPAPPAPRELAAPNPPPAAPRELAPVQTPAPVVEPKVDEPEAHPLLTALDLSMPFFVDGARRDEPVEPFAEIFVNRIGDEHIPELAAFLESGDTVLDQLAVRYPETTPFRAWFTRLVVEMLNLLEEEPEHESGAASDSEHGDDASD